MAAHRYWRIYITAIGAGGSDVDISEIELRASQGGADETGSGTASASSVYASYVAANVVDDDTGTSWVSNGFSPYQWWAYDFGVGVTKDIVEVAILPRQDLAPEYYNRFPTAFRLQYSDDGAEYFDVVSWVSVWFANSQQIFQVSPPADNGYYRYWGLFITAPDLCGASEIEFRASQGGADETGSGSAGADSSLDGSLLPPNAFDNSTSTAWLSNGAAGPHWIGYDFGLGVTKKIVEVAITPRTSPDQPQYCANNFYLQGWNSGQSPVDIYNFTTTWPNVNQQVFTVPASAITLTVDGAIHSQAAESPTLTQVHFLSSTLDLVTENGDPVVDESGNQLTAEVRHLYSKHVLGSESPILLSNSDSILVVSDSLHSLTSKAPDLTQVHNLSVSGGVHGQEVDGVSLIQVYVLDAADSAHILTSESLSLTQVHSLSVEDSVHNQSSDFLDLTQAHNLSAVDAVHGHTVESFDLIQAHALAIEDTIHTQSAEVLDLTQVHNLIIKDEVHGQRADNIDLTQVHNLAMFDVSHVLESTSPDLTQVHNLTIEAGDHALSSDNVELLLEGELAVSDGSHVLTSNDIALIQAHTIVSQDAIHGQDAEELGLTQVHNLVVSDNNHVLTSPELDLSGSISLEVSDGHQDLASDSFALTQAHILAPQDSAHGMASDYLTLAQASALIMAAGNHLLSSDNVELVSLLPLTVSGSAHGVSSEAPNLTQIHALAVNGSIHIIGSDGVVLTQFHHLAIQDALHALTSDSVAFVSKFLDPHDCLHGHTADTIYWPISQLIFQSEMGIFDYQSEKFNREFMAEPLIKEFRSN